MHPLRLLAPIAATLLIASVGLRTEASSPLESGSVEGRLVLQTEKMGLADLGPIVVYLTAREGTPALPRRASTFMVSQKNALFEPSFLAVAAGDTVALSNDDDIHHNVFSYSHPNEFDLGLYPAGESYSVVMNHEGVVRTYCSIHESMNGTIFVSPTRAFAKPDASGRFEISDVPPGDYTLHVWCERLPEIKRDISLRAGDTLPLEIPLLAE